MEPRNCEQLGRHRHTDRNAEFPARLTATGRCPPAIAKQPDYHSWTEEVIAQFEKRHPIDGRFRVIVGNAASNAW